MGTLTYTSSVIDIPDAMDWPNEFSYRMVEQKTQYSVTGALLIESALKQAGRKIELRGGETWAWMPREDIVALCALANQAGIEIALEFRGESFDVIFDHEAGAIEMTPIQPYEDPDTADNYFAVLRFIVL